MIGTLLLFFIILPLADMYLLLTIGSTIGTANTLALIIATGIIGGILYQRQSRNNMRQLAAAAQQGILPDIELIDRVLITIGAILLVTPGIITDLAGFSTLIPYTRPLVRNVIKHWLKKYTNSGHVHIKVG